MKFKKGDRVEVIWRSELHQGLVEEVIELTDELTDELMVKLAKTPAIYYLFKKNQVSKVELVKVPKFVADWYEQHRHKLEYSIWGYIYDWDDQDCESDFYDFMKNDNLKPVETLIKMKDGYEVEKEPLYYVHFIEGIGGYLNMRYDGHQRSNGKDQNYEYKTQFTEAEIKAMDKGEAYWLLREPVEEVEGEA
ncbi:hypothetical protein HS73_15245 [Listeria monocytogenes]|uniref:DUF1642 domain-containing protein n=4 Tax=Listeria monocytogenes TaxID=1639 RepID=UPI0004D8B8CA|nr:DUF1642 domain-containing protein [Listeria monocytogenes]KES97460.1 hypothetical protein HR88_15615 [Listeria monocytogenes]KET50016.1 hypothetical protein HS08_15255 [Listeria monocytogenes]KET51002.1 hypothetical protein HR96_00445 [Listeria monocytogenes]KET82004.1 hypothetical protein HS96_15255 [Listeria monocytogenes]KET93241.1 hypothetical protein HS11_15225 [Listeria monocytogenes]